MRYSELFHDPTNGAADVQARAEKIAKATDRKRVANLRYQAKVSAAQNAVKLASTSADPATGAARREAATRRIGDARGVLQRAISSAGKSINDALTPPRN